MSRIDEFIGQGLLPFVGRESELGKIEAFRQSIPDAQRLRLLLLTAEAGVGKSRLLEEVLRRIDSERGGVVHVKLYPEAANSPAALLARSLWKSSAGRAILHSMPGENLSAVIPALQRLARLRPTLLVLEDIHLFPSESIPDLARLFESLSDETISVLCLSRPTTIAALGVLESYLVESITMEGLTPEALTQLWEELFESTPPKEIVDRLYGITTGNGLAIRSGLRWGVQSGVIARVPGRNEWRIRESIRAFEQGLRRSVSLVAEGMVAHLRKEDRRHLEELSTLGEVFAREGARRLDPEIDTLLSDLTQQGIILETIHPVSPLAGVPLTEPGKGWAVEYPSSSAPLLSFTHSLLHGYLADRAPINAAALLRLISDNVPLYSLLPLRLLEKVMIPDDTEIDVVIRAIRRLSAIAVVLDRTASWRDGADLLKPLYRLLEHLERKTDAEESVKLLWRMNAQHISLSILRRSMDSPEWIETHERQLRITENPETLLAAQYRILAHTYVLDRIGFDKTYEEGIGIIPDLDELLERFVELRTDISYVYLLESLIHHAFANGDEEMMRGVEERTYRMLADPNLGEGGRQGAIRRILPVFLKFYSTPEELREREESIPLIEEHHSETDPFYGTAKIQFLGVSGRLIEAFDLTEPVLRRAPVHGLWMNLLVVQSWRVISAVGIGYSFAQMEEESVTLLRTTPDYAEKERLTETMATAFVIAGFLAGKPDEGIERTGSLGFSPADLPEGIRVLAELSNGNTEILQGLNPPIRGGKFLFNSATLLAWKRLADSFPSGTASLPAEAVNELVDLLETPILQIYDLLTIRGTMFLVQGLTKAPLPDSLREALLRRTIRALAWLHEREVPAYMKPLTSLLEELGSLEAAKEWNGKIGEEREIATSEPAVRGNETIRISMLGSIRVALPPEELAPIRGVRIRTLLGLMVADQMIGTPLSQEEFLRLAGGMESDPEHARKKKNMAVVRLREIIGHDAILTDGPTPQLNTDILSVDLLEVNGCISKGLEAIRQGAFVRALPVIEEAIDLYGGEVPFPTLYEDFFEAARGDFEYRLRRAILEIGRGMLDLGDAAGVEQLLRRGMEVLPGDEEIAGLLREALEVSGNRIEAERIKMRMETSG